MRRIILIIVLVIVLSLAGMRLNVFADQKDDLMSFRGLNGVYVTIDDLSPYLEQSGISKELIRNDIELKLRIAGIKVLTLEEWKMEEGIPHLNVIVSAIHAEQGGIFPVAIFVQLRQSVRLIRNSSLMDVATWSDMSHGLSSKEQIRPNINHKVDQFINIYLSANPKK